MNHLVCTLFEKDYHYGVAALANSLYASGYRGTIYAGMRGELPPWAKPTTAEGTSHRFRVAEGLDILFIPLTTTLHMTNYKPRFMLDLLSEYGQDASAIYYIDPDIVVNCTWALMKRWAKGSIALVQDQWGDIREHDPLRIGWADWMKAQGIPITRVLNTYFNAGFVGLDAAHQDFLGHWEDLINRACKESGNSSQICTGGTREELFYLPDQDALNLAIASSPIQLNAVGPHGMDFFPPYGTLLSHAVANPKPWRGGFFKLAFQGIPPQKAIKQFFRYIQAPIRVFIPAKERSLRRSLWMAERISRFYVNRDIAPRR